MTFFKQDNIHSQTDDALALFYLERVLEQLEGGYCLLAKRNFRRYEEHFSTMLEAEHFGLLLEKANRKDEWGLDKEKQLAKRLSDAATFMEYKVVHDCCHEILLHHHHRADTCPTHAICDWVTKALAQNNAHYIEPDEVQLNTHVDIEVEFVVEKRRSGDRRGDLKGNPGFHWKDVLGQTYRCFIKQVEDVRVGETIPLKVTNIPGITVNSGAARDPIIYLEPRVEAGELIEIEISSLSYTGNSFTFRHNSYDGFLWFKRRGVNKEIFNERTLRPGDKIVAKVLYTTDEEKRTPSGNITRLGIIKAIPIKRVEEPNSIDLRHESGPARAYN